MHQQRLSSFDPGPSNFPFGSKLTSAGLANHERDIPFDPSIVFYHGRPGSLEQSDSPTAPALLTGGRHTFGMGASGLPGGDLCERKLVYRSPLFSLSILGRAGRDCDCDVTVFVIVTRNAPGARRHPAG